MIHRLLCVVVLVALSLTGCSTVNRWFGRDSTAQAKQGRSLEVPPSMSRATTTDLMSIPGERAGSSVSLSAAGSQVSAPGDRSSVLREPKGMAVVRRGERSWLEADQSVDKVYSLLVDFFATAEIPLETQEPRLGLLETDWIDNVLATPRRFFGMVVGPQIKDRFRVRIERGVRPDTAEVFFTHYSAEMVMIEDPSTGNVVVERIIDGDSGSRLRPDWKVRPSDPAAESEMLRRFIAFADGDAAVAGDLKASAREVQSVSRLVENEAGYDYSLVLDARFFDAWRMVGLAIDRANFTITDQDRALGRYFVRFDPTVGAEGKKGFWSSLAFWRKDQTISAGIYSFLVIDEGSSVRVVAQSEAGEPVPADLSQRILTLLDEQLD